MLGSHARRSSITSRLPSAHSSRLWGKRSRRCKNDKAYTLAYLRKYMDEKDDRLGEMGFDRLIKQVIPNGDVDIEALRDFTP